jgi:hypothetical protein
LILPPGHRNGSVAPPHPHPPLVTGGGTNSLGGEGAGGANSDEGTDTLVLYSMMTMIPLRQRIVCKNHIHTAYLIHLNRTPLLKEKSEMITLSYIYIIFFNESHQDSQIKRSVLFYLRVYENCPKVFVCLFTSV